MHATLPLLRHSDFPELARAQLETLQVNVGDLCNQSCLHCHVNAGPKRTEIMDADTVDDILRFLDRSDLRVLDLTGGAPELNPHFRTLVLAARARGLDVIDRCNLTVLLAPGQEDTAAFLADNQVKIVASMPCYIKENVDAQRGDGTFVDSLTALRRLNELGYGKAGSGRVLDLVYNPQGPVLPPAQQALEADYRQHLDRQYGIRFNSLLTLANMPIRRFGSTLVSRGQFDDYLQLLKHAHQDENLAVVMSRTLLNVDWRGFVYDCDFNQMLGLPMSAGRQGKIHITELTDQDLSGRAINVADHCYGCTAGQGSGCSGALV